MRSAKFGKAPSGERLAKIQNSPNYRNGQFQNQSPTRDLAEGQHLLGVTFNQLFKKAANRSPAAPLPSVKTDLTTLSPDRNVLVWFGHSSYFFQLDGKRFLVDPVFSGNASPIPGTVKAFKGADIYTVADLPPIDYLFITHDHYDHLDHQTIVALKEKIGRVICGLGVGAHLEYWGYAGEKITEADWGDTLQLDENIVVHATPARHFSGRSLARNKTLWLSYVLQSRSLRLFLGGDSGYDRHFAEIGKTFGPFDLAILDNGQYNLAWRYIHTLPEEVVKAAQDLKTRRLLPVHSSKFVLANHPWNEPLSKVSELSKSIGLPLATPMIGEIVELNEINQRFEPWWVGR